MAVKWYPVIDGVKSETPLSNGTNVNPGQLTVVSGSESTAVRFVVASDTLLDVNCTLTPDADVAYSLTENGVYTYGAPITISSFAGDVDVWVKCRSTEGEQAATYEADGTDVWEEQQVVEYTTVLTMTHTNHAGYYQAYADGNPYLNSASDELAYGWYDLSNYGYAGGMIFDNSTPVSGNTVPQGATIVSAVIEEEAKTDHGGPVVARTWGIVHPSTANFYNVADFQADLTIKTTAFTEQTIGTWTPGSKYTTDVTDQIQEIINQLNGNNIKFIKGDPYSDLNTPTATWTLKNAYGYDANFLAKRPTLTITYTL